MEMLSNGYGCIRKRSKTLKQSLFDWMLHKFNNLLISTMSDIPTASTSTASTSSASTSQINPYSFRLGNQDIDCTTTDDSEISSDDDLDVNDEESSNNSNEIECTCDESDDNMDDTSWSSVASSNVSCAEKSGSDNSETENTNIKHMIRETLADKSTDKSSDENVDESTTTTTTTPILILVQQPCETEGQMNEIGIDLINVEEHAKRLRELEKELDFIETTEWMYRPIDSCIR